MRNKLKKCLFAALIALISPLAYSQSVQDQGFVISDFFEFGGPAVSSGTMLWQSFTVGIEGELDRVDLQLYKQWTPTEPLDVWIVENDSWNYVAHTQIQPESVAAMVDNAAMVSAFFDNPVGLQENSQWRILITTNDTANQYNWTLASNDVYIGGAGSDQLDRWNAYSSGRDYAFLTYMTPGEVSGSPEILGTAPIPEPSTYAALFGIAAIAFAIRRKFRR